MLTGRTDAQTEIHLFFTTALTYMKSVQRLMNITTNLLSLYSCSYLSFDSKHRHRKMSSTNTYFDKPETTTQQQPLFSSSNAQVPTVPTTTPSGSSSKKTAHTKNNRFRSIQTTVVERGILKKRQYVSKWVDASTRENTTKTIERHDEACGMVDAILQNAECAYDIVLFSEFEVSKKSRSDAYYNYYVLCKKNRKQSADWLVCKYVLTGSCVLEERTKRFDGARGTTKLLRHSESHEMPVETKVLCKCSTDEKGMIAEAAAKAATLDTLPLNFTYKRIGFLLIAKALVDLGQRHPVSEEIYVKDVIPSPPTVRDAIMKMAINARDEMKTSTLNDMCVAAGGITCDGVMVEQTGHKYYDFVLHYIDIEAEDRSSNRPRWCLRNRVLFIARCSGSETAETLRETIDAHLTPYGIFVQKLKRHFTFVTDCEATMRAVFGPSVSPNRVPYSELWVGCAPHQLNTAMKHGFDNATDEHVRKDVESMKKLIRIFKKNGMNDKLPSGTMLKQELSTRFGTTIDTVERFVAAVPEVIRVIEASDIHSSKSASEALDEIKCENSSYPNLHAVLKCFQPIRHAQTMLESSKTPTLMMVLPVLEELKKKLNQISRGISQAPNFEPVFSYDQSLAMSTLNAIQKINLHDIWCAACLIHPGLRGMCFIQDSSQRLSLREKGVKLLSKMIEAEKISSS